MASFLYFSLFCLLTMYKKNCTKNIKCSSLKCAPVYFIHCRNPLNCSQISVLMPSRPSMCTDLEVVSTDVLWNEINDAKILYLEISGACYLNSILRAGRKSHKTNVQALFPCICTKLQKYLFSPQTHSLNGSHMNGHE